MQIILNGQSFRPPSLDPATVWCIVEELENNHGWRRVSTADTLISLEKVQ